VSRRIILASASKQRLTIFKTLGIEFEVVPSNIDEQQIQAKDVLERAEKIARAKAKAVIVEHPDAIVIAADTYAYLDGQILEKPDNNQQAKQMLQKLSGNEFLALTGFCYLDITKKIDFSIVKQIKVKCRKITDAQMDHYIKTEPVTTWSAAFSPAYPAGASLIAEVNGSFNGFTYGLPVEELISLLEKSGVIC
jgi:MAF protein